MDIEEFAEFEEELEEMFEKFPIPPGMPPEFVRMIFEEAKGAAARGESLEDLQARLFGMMTGGRKGRKGRRR